MYSFINDISISPLGYTCDNSWSLLKTIMNMTSKLSDFNIENIRVPTDFTSRVIGSHKSISEHLSELESEENREVRSDDRNQLYNFLANQLEEADSEIENILANVQQNRLIEVSVNTVPNPSPSQILTEAFVMKCPVVSFQTDGLSCSNLLACNLLTLGENNTEVNRPVRLKNIFEEASINFHHEYLIEWKHKIQFAKSRWNPIEQPIWNELTQQTLSELNFPESVTKRADKYEELERVGSIIAEMNGWKYDELITKKNKNKGHYRRIFYSRFVSRLAYLSIDFENPYGGFEVHDHRGKHQGQIDFNGAYNKEADTTGNHDIEI